MKVSFIGAGKVGTAFGLYIKSFHEVLYYHSRTMASAIRAANKVDARPTNDLALLLEDSEVIFITTNDQNIEMVVKEIIDLNLTCQNKYFLHMSGALSSEVLLPLRNKGAKTASMHPLQTFPTPEKGFAHLNSAYFALEGQCEFLIDWLKDLGNPYFVLEGHQKSQYHMAACIFSNYLVTLMAFGSEMLKAIGIDEKQGLKAMLPLVQATLNNVMTLGPEAALTGPLKRGDLLTLENHMKNVEGLNLSLYQTLMAWTSENLIGDPNQVEMLKALWRTHES